MARVKTQHRHLCEPLHDRLALLLRDAVNVGKTELVYHVRYDRCMATLKGLVEKMDQLCRVPGDDVLRLRVQGVRNGNRDGDMLALVEEVTGRTLSLTHVLVRLEVVDNRVGVRFRLPLWAAGVCPGGGLFVFPLLHHRVTHLAEKLSSAQGETVGILSFHGLALGIPPCDHLTLPGFFLHKLLAIVGIALLATMPETTVELEDRLRLWVIPVH